MEYRPVLHELPHLASFGVRIFGFTATTCGLLHATLHELGLSSWGLDIMEQPLEIRANIRLRVKVVSNGSMITCSEALVKRELEAWTDATKGRVFWFTTCTVNDVNQLYGNFARSFPQCTVLRMVGVDKQEASSALKVLRERAPAKNVLLTTTSCAIQGIDLDVDVMVMLNAYSPVDVFQFAHRGGRRSGSGLAEFTLMFSIGAMRQCSRDDIVRRSQTFCDRFTPRDKAQALSACTQVGVIQFVAAHVSGGVCLRVALLRAMGAADGRNQMATRCPAHAQCSVCGNVENFRDMSIASLREIAIPTTSTTMTTTTTTPNNAAEPGILQLQLHHAAKENRLLKDRRELYAFASSWKSEGEVACFACGKKGDSFGHFGACKPQEAKVLAFQGNEWHSSYAHQRACGYCGQSFTSKPQSLGKGALNIMVTHSSSTKNIQLLTGHANKRVAIEAYNKLFCCAVLTGDERRSISAADECLLHHDGQQCNEGLRWNVRWILMRIFFMVGLRGKVSGEPFRLDLNRFKGFGAFFEHVLREGDVSSKANLCEQLVVWWLQGCGRLI